MATLPGRCINDMYCALAASGEIVRVPAEGKYVCPHCGKTLVPPNTPWRGRRPRRAGRQPLLVTLLVLGGFAGGVAIGSVFLRTPAAPPAPELALPPVTLLAVPSEVVLHAPPPLIVPPPRPHRHH